MKKLPEEKKGSFYLLLESHNLLSVDTATKESILEIDPEVRPYFEKMHSAARPKARVVDFNQGIDSRLVTEENMRKLAEICIKPLRIAFDHWELRDIYEKAVRKAASAGITELSNYLLYNYNDKPEELYYRLKYNVELCEELNVSIYSFPMKYHPITDPDYFSNRDYIGEYWNRKYIRAIQSVLNSTHGKIGRGRTFFFKAFGRNLEEFHELLDMPEAFIIRRWDAEISGLKTKWLRARKAMSVTERDAAMDIVKTNVFNADDIKKQPVRVAAFLSYYIIRRADIPEVSEQDKRTYIAEFEASCTSEVSDLCRELLAQC